MFYWVLHIISKLIESITERVWWVFLSFQSVKSVKSVGPTFCFWELNVISTHHRLLRLKTNFLLSFTLPFKFLYKSKVVSSQLSHSTFAKNVCIFISILHFYERRHRSWFIYLEGGYTWVCWKSRDLLYIPDENSLLLFATLCNTWKYKSSGRYLLFA